MLFILSLVATLVTPAFSQDASVVKPAIGTGSYHWVNTWGAMPQLTEFANLPPTAFGYNQTDLVFFNTTIRQTIHTSIGAQQVRLRLSNRFGITALPITAVTIAYVG